MQKWWPLTEELGFNLSVIFNTITLWCLKRYRNYINFHNRLQLDVVIINRWSVNSVVVAAGVCRVYSPEFRSSAAYKKWALEMSLLIGQVYNLSVIYLWGSAAIAFKWYDVFRNCLFYFPSLKSGLDVFKTFWRLLVENDQIKTKLQESCRWHTMPLIYVSYLII